MMCSFILTEARYQFGLNSFDFEFRLGASYDEVARRQVENNAFENSGKYE